MGPGKDASMEMIEHYTESFRLYPVLSCQDTEQRIERQVVFQAVEDYFPIDSLYIKMMERTVPIEFVLSRFHSLKFSATILAIIQE